MPYRTPHFLDCTCQCEYKRLLLQARLTNFNKLSVFKRSFLLIDVGGPRPKPSHDTVQYDEYQCIGVPTNAWVMERLRGNIGDLFIDITPNNHALYAKISATEWKKWPGPLSITDALRHPLYPNYVLWCHPSTRTISWFFDLLINKAYHDGSDHDIIFAILEERREAGAKQPPKRKFSSEGQEVTFRKKLKRTTKTSHIHSPAVSTATRSTVDATSGPFETIARLEQEALRLKNDNTALQKLLTTAHPISSLVSGGSLRSVSNPLHSPSPHSSAIPVGKVTMSKPCYDRSPNPLESDIPLGPPPRCTSDEGDRNLGKSSESAAVDNSECADTVLTALGPEKEANVNSSPSGYSTDAMNDNTFIESVIADLTGHVDALETYEHNSLTAQDSDIDLPSNRVDLVTPEQPDHDLDIDGGNSVERAAKARPSPVSIPSESLQREAPNDQSVDNQVRGISVEGASVVTTGVSCLNLHSDDALTMAVTHDPDKNSLITFNQPFPQSTDPSTTSDPAVMKGAISEPPSDCVDQSFRLNCSLKEILFHVSRNSRLICRLCLGTQESLYSFSGDVPLEDLTNHCVKEHLHFCEVLREMSAEEIDAFKRHFSH